MSIDAASAFDHSAAPAITNFSTIPVSSEDQSSTIVIIGGGMSGSLSLIAQINNIERDITKSTVAELHGMSDIDIVLFDVPGDPYDHPDYVFSLNQPVSRMSLFPDRPTDFMEWLADKQREFASEAAEINAAYNTLISQGYSPERIGYEHPEVSGKHHVLHADEDSYMPRSIFGHYMDDRKAQAIARIPTINAKLQEAGVSARISFTPINERVIAATRNGNKITISSDSYAVDSTHQIIATGHVMNDLLRDMRQFAGYADTPFDMPEISHAVENAKRNGKPILLAGTGQAMIDALGGLVALQYDGEVVAVSGENIEPWPNDHKQARIAPENFAYHHDLIASLQQCCDAHLDEDEAYRQFSTALQGMMHCEPVVTAGPMHLIWSLQRSEAEMQGALGGYSEGFVGKILAQVSAHDSNSTSPSKYMMYQGLKSTGKLQLKSGRVSGCEHGVDGGCDIFHVRMKDIGTGEIWEMEAGAILNSASMSRAALDRQGHALHPVIGKLMEIGALVPCELSPGSVKPADRTTLALVGTSDGEGPFGVPYNRDEIWYKNEQIVEGMVLRPRAEGGAPALALGIAT